jgi:hypothetical protein
MKENTADYLRSLDDEELLRELVEAAGDCAHDLTTLSDRKRFDQVEAHCRERIAQVEKMRAALRRIDVDYREASGLPLHLQAYCMRSEAKVALGLESAEAWAVELAGIKATV